MHGNPMVNYYYYYYYYYRIHLVTLSWISWLMILISLSLSVVKNKDHMTNVDTYTLSLMNYNVHTHC